MGETSIEWTDRTWNPTTGCTKVSPGCKLCYAERVFPRSYSRETVPLTVGEGGPGSRRRKFTDVRTHPNRLEQPLYWRKPQRIFVNSMSDLFHEEVPEEFIDRVFAVMALTPQHTYQILTKRPERMREYLSDELLYQRIHERIKDRMGYDNPKRPAFNAFDLPLPNVWLGVSVENQEYADKRIFQLLSIPAAVYFVSYEPALGPVNFQRLRPEGYDWYDSLEGRRHEHPSVTSGWPKLDWVIVGGESGPGARPFNIQWAREVVRQCKEAGVACFVKQLGKNPYEAPEGIGPNTSGPDSVKCRLVELDIDKSHGGDMLEWPEDLRVREFPSRGGL